MMENSNNYFQLIAKFNKNIEWLNKVLLGGETDYVVIDGVGKPSISKEFADRFSELQAMVQGQKTYTTKAAMDGDLSPSADTIAMVWSDPNSQNNGWYGKVGASGSGS